MKNLKRIFSVIISLTMVFSLFGAFSAQAASATGIKKWSVYENNQNRTVGNEISRLVNGSKATNEWRLETDDDVGYNHGVYAADPDNGKNVAVKYTAYSAEKDGKLTNNQIAYYPTTTIADNKSFTVEIRIKLKDTGVETNDTDNFRIYGSTKSSNEVRTVTLQRRSDGNYAMKVSVDGSAVINKPSTGIKAGDWVDIKFEEDVTAGTVSLYVNGALVGTSESATKEGFTLIDYKHSPYTTTVAAAPTYIDDLKITAADTTDMMYYEDFATSYNYAYMQGTGSETIDVYDEVKLVDADGEETGYSVPLYATVSADVSKLGTFSTTKAVPGFDEPLAISWTVYKEGLAWEETFENYTETDIGKAPDRSPWTGGTTGKTIAYEDAEAEVKNTVLKYTASAQDSDWLKMSDGKYIDGKFSVEFSFMLPELKANSQFVFPLIRESGHPFVEPSVSVNSSGNGQFAFNHYIVDGANEINAGTVYLVESGDLEANKWYKAKFTIDTQTQTFTYAFDDVEYTEEYGARYQNNTDAQAKPSFSQFRLAQRSTSLSTEATIYVDNVKTTKLLTIQEPVAKTITVYKGDEAALPETATVLLTDGETTDEAEVSWNGSIDTSAVGTKTITGAVTGTSTPAALNVEVSAFPYEIVSANLKNGSTEVFGLIKGGALSSATLNKIANDTKAGRVYAAVYDENQKLLGANAVTIDTSSAWSKDANKDITISLTLPDSNEINIDTCTLKLFVLSDSLIPFAPVKAQSNADAQAVTTVWIAGGSLAEEKTDSARPETGWGEALEELCTNTGITVENRALGGRSSKSFYDQGILRDILNEAAEGDYLFIQFGHNDSKESDATRYTTPTEGGTYEEYMTRYVTEARAKGVIPVILTSVVRAKYDANGAFIGGTYDELDDYATAAKRVAAAYHVPVIDLHALTDAKFSALTKEEVWKYFDYYADTTTLEVGNADTTHLNEAGAELVADMIKTEMENIRLALYKLFN